MQRREFITLLGGATVAWPLATRAQQPGMPVLGFVSGRSPKASVGNVAAFRKGLAEADFVEGGNVQVQYRWAEGHYDRQPELIAELIRQPVAVLTVFNIAAALAAKQATATLPIVFGASGDPVKLGLVANFNRPGGNVTGVSFLNSVLIAKQFEVLHELVSPPAVLAVLVNPTYANLDEVMTEAQRAARSLVRKLVFVKAINDDEIDTAFGSIKERQIGGLLVAADPFLDSRQDRVIELAARQAVPTVYASRESPPAGGLISYGSDLAEAFHLVGGYAGRILKGAKPADLPVQQTSKVELIINLKTAKELRLTVPATLLTRADEVIE